MKRRVDLLCDTERIPARDSTDTHNLYRQVLFKFDRPTHHNGRGGCGSRCLVMGELLD